MAGGGERRVLQVEAKETVQEAVQELSPRLRDAVYLRYWGEHTYREIAGRLGCPLQTARSRVRLAFDCLRPVLARDTIADLGENGRTGR